MAQRNESPLNENPLNENALTLAEVFEAEALASDDVELLKAAYDQELADKIITILGALPSRTRANPNARLMTEIREAADLLTPEEIGRALMLCRKNNHMPWPRNLLRVLGKTTGGPIGVRLLDTRKLGAFE